MGHIATQIPSALSLADLNTTVNHEPRVSHVRLAQTLGLTQHHKLRHMIERNADEFRRYGEVPSTVDETPSAKGGRPGQILWLNEAQALLACIRSNAPNAPDARQMLIEVYMAWRRGQLPEPPRTKTVTVRSHLRRVKDKSDPRQMLLPPPVIRDGIGMLIVGDRVVWFDANTDLDLFSQDAVVVDMRGGLRVEHCHSRNPIRPQGAILPFTPDLPMPDGSRGGFPATVAVGRVIAIRRI